MAKVTLNTSELRSELELLLQLAAKTLKDHGISHWKLSLVARNPDEPGQWVNITNDDPAAVAETISSSVKDERDRFQMVAKHYESILERWAHHYHRDEVGVSAALLLVRHLNAAGAEVLPPA